MEKLVLSVYIGGQVMNKRKYKWIIQPGLNSLCFSSCVVWGADFLFPRFRGLGGFLRNWTTVSGGGGGVQ